MKHQDSIAKKLIFKLNIALSSLLILIFATTFWVAKNEINQIFDAELKKSALIIFEIAKNHDFNSSSENLEEKLHHKFFNRYDYEIVLNIWNKDKLIYNSNNKIKFENSNKEGFYDTSNSKQKWRNFVFIDQSNQLKIAIFENYQIRQTLILELSSAIFFTIFAFFIIIIVSIVKIVKQELKPIHDLSQKIVSSSLNKFKTINTQNYPFEVQPFILSFNQLMLKLQHNLENEKKFTNHAAHELNTPLTAIRLQAEILQNKYSKNQSLNFNNIIIAVDRASHLIDQILVLSRIEGEIAKENFEYQNVKHLFNETIEEFKYNQKNKTATLLENFNFFTNKTPIKIHKTFFQILLFNILDNAFKYNLNNNPIEININNDKNYLSIEVINSSEDLRIEDKEKVFNKFFRANRSPQSKNIDGCGLGLNIVKQIVDIHKGKITFKNYNAKTIILIEFNNNLIS